MLHFSLDSGPALYTRAVRFEITVKYASAKETACPAQPQWRTRHGIGADRTEHGRNPSPLAQILGLLLGHRRAEHCGRDPTSGLTKTRKAATVSGTAGCTVMRSSATSRGHGEGNELGWQIAEDRGWRTPRTLRLGREEGGGVAAAAVSGPFSDQESRPAVEACGFLTGTALSISLPLAGFKF